MIITNTCISRGGSEVTLECDNGQKYTITLADARRLGLVDTDEDEFPVEFSDEETIEFLADKLRAIRYCTYLLGFSDKSEKNLRKKLCEKGYSSDVIDCALDILRQGGIIDDSSLCLKKYTSLATGKLYGPYRIRSELSAKGFSSEDIKKAEEECGLDFEDLLFELCEKLLSSGRINLSDRDVLAKFKAKLSRYGYGYSEISSVLERFCDSDEDFYE